MRPRHCCVELLFRRVAVSTLRCYVTYERESTRPHIAFRFFFLPYTRIHRLPIGVKIAVPLATENVGREHSRTPRMHAQPAKFHVVSSFFRRCPPGRDFDGPPRILDSAVLISEL